MTSLVDLGLPVTMADADAALRAAFIDGVRAGRGRDAGQDEQSQDEALHAS